VCGVALALVWAVVGTLVACGSGSSSPAAVALGGTGTATISWSAPTQNTDGTALQGVTGYRVRYGTNPANLSASTGLLDAARSSVDIAGLAVGTWYFAVTVRDGAGTESDLSAIVTTTIR
jgi:hypothetical protein